MLVAERGQFNHSLATTRARCPSFVSAESDGSGDAVAALLSAGNRVVIALPNGPEAATALLALCVRCAVAPLDINVTAEEAM